MNFKVWFTGNCFINSSILTDIHNRVDLNNYGLEDITNVYKDLREGNELYFLPVPTIAGETISFNYYTKNWIYQSVGDVYQDTFQDDTDAPLLDARLIILGTVWRWKHARGLEYGQDFDNYERAVADKTARDGPKPIITLDGEPQDTIAPVAIVPTGNWTI